MATNYNSVGYESLLIEASALKLVGATTLVIGAKSFVGTLETASVRYRADKTDPTSSEGELLSVGDQIILSEQEIENMAFIRTGGTSGTLKGHYYSAAASVFTGGG